MGKQEKKEIGLSSKLFTAYIAGITLLLFMAPSSADLLVYDRGQIAAGQVWRLFTGSFVHFSPSHLLFNLIVFVVAGWTIASRGYPGFRMFCTLSAGLIGLASYVLTPDMVQYGGLSGIACGAVVYLALHGLSEKGLWRNICTVTLLLTACKILVEYRLGHFLFVSSSDGTFVPAPLSHAVGSLTAVMVFLLGGVLKDPFWAQIKEEKNESNGI